MSDTMLEHGRGEWFAWLTAEAGLAWESGTLNRSSR